LKEKLSNTIFQVVSQASEELGVHSYVIGGWVRDQILERPSTDIDIVVAGSGVELAKRVAEKLNKADKLKVYRNFGTAMLRHREWQVEFVGARKESYRASSRKPIVEDGSLDDDMRRRDFTINAMAVSLNQKDFGNMLDPFNGMQDIRDRCIRTPLDPDVTYSDDPLRMMRAIRFAAQLDFLVDASSFEAIQRHAGRITIVSVERVMDEFNKIMLSPAPGKGIKKLRSSGLLKHFFPELDALYGVDEIDGKAHKDNFFHTLQVLDNVALKSEDLWLRWAALLHDIAKPTGTSSPVTKW